MFPLLSGTVFSLRGPKAALAQPKTRILAAQSPAAKIQYPDLLGGDSVRERGDWFDNLRFDPRGPSLTD
jgi:hypothetical protein